MSPKSLLIAAALAATTMATVPAAAQGQQGTAGAPPASLRSEILFNLVDANSDGSIDQTEIAALQRAIFAAIDTDGNGQISEEEFSKVMAGPRARIANFMEQRGPDGRQGPGFGHRHGPRGERQGQLEDRGPGNGPRFGQFGQNQSAPGLDDSRGGGPRDFASLDTNGDGVVSADEFAAGAPLMPMWQR